MEKKRKEKGLITKGYKFSEEKYKVTTKGGRKHGSTVCV
jgi:hypothetical protein